MVHPMSSNPMSTRSTNTSSALVVYDGQNDDTSKSSLPSAPPYNDDDIK